MKKLVIILVALVALAGSAWVGRAAYRSWKQEHLLKQARYYLSKSDVANALLCLRGALQSNPSNVQACRLYADLLEAGHNRNAIGWRQRVVELEPSSTPDRLVLAKTALMFGDTATAGDAMKGVGEDGKKSVEYVKAAAALAWARKDYSEAESDYTEAARLEPTNLFTRLNFATVLLVSTNAAKAEQGRQALEELRGSETLRCQALRELILDASHSGLNSTALSYSTELQNDPSSTFADHLAHLDILNRAKSPQFAGYLASMQQQSATNLNRAYELGQWYFAQGKTNEGIAWVLTLPPAIQTNLPMPILVAEGRVTLCEWPTLETTLKTQDWKELDYLRRAFLARALRARGDSADSSLQWESAMRVSSKRLDGLNELARRAAMWDWQRELDDALWTITENYPSDTAAFVVLHHRLFLAGDTRGLHKLLTRTYAASPTNSDLENNLAIVSLLLDPKETKAYDLARDAYTKDPKNPIYLSAYAFSLHLQHKSSEALKLYDNLSSQQLTNPPVATYYGIILTGAGDSAKAKLYLELADGARLLPEEASLVKKARQGI